MRDTWQAPDLVTRVGERDAARAGSDLLSVAGMQESWAASGSGLIQPQIFAIMLQRFGGNGGS
jgi:hypothetical protein